MAIFMHECYRRQNLTLISTVNTIPVNKLQNFNTKHAQVNVKSSKFT